jgi:large subunit ribosomal protein L6
MSRVGKKPVLVPSGVTVSLSAEKVSVKGPKGEKDVPLHSGVSAKITEVEKGKKMVQVSRTTDTRIEKSLHGLIRNEIHNAIVGVAEGYQKTLEISGVGYRAAITGKSLTFSLGFSHPVLFELPKGIEASIEKQTVLTIKGSDKYLVGQVAAKIRDMKRPEPYKGKGIKYKDEQIIRKEGKSGKK